MLTRLRRSCTAITHEICHLQTLTKSDLELIGEHFPSTINNLRKELFYYEDENMVMRRQFVANIPYFRNLSEESVDQITFLMEQQNYRKGEVILSQDEFSDCIMVVMEGVVQVLISGDNSDYWLADIDIGTCFNVYNCFSEGNITSLVSYRVISKRCQIEFISTKDLQKLSSHFVEIHDALNIGIQRIKNSLVDDIDYFLFPKKYLEQKNNNKTREDIQKERLEYIKTKQEMKDRILQYAADIRARRERFPIHIEMIFHLRKQRKKLGECC